MSNTISSTTPVNQSYTTQHASQAPKPAKKPEPPQDTVVLSQQAKTASQDHDGK